MNYPNISDDDVRNGIAHITTALVSTVRLATLIVNATNLVEGLMASQIDLTSLKALGTTPALWKDAIIFKTRSLALIDKYGSSRTGSTTDITSWENMMLGIINGLKSGELQLLDSSGM